MPAVRARWLSEVASLLGSGSVLLLLAGITLGAVQAGAAGLLMVLLSMAVLLHVFGWAAIYNGGADGSDRGTRAFDLSAIAFGGGATASAFLVPSGAFWLLLFPFLPFVFGPVVLVHAHLFLSGTAVLPESPRSLIRAGAGLLTAIALIGMLGQVSYALGAFRVLETILGVEAARHFVRWTVLPLPAGLTASGYGLIWRGWTVVAGRRQECSGRETQAQA